MSTIEKSIEVNVPVSTAYNQWTQFEEFPKFMEGVEQVQQIGDTHLRWVAEIAGQRREWEAEITDQVPDQTIAWRSTGGAKNDGIVRFEPIDDNSTKVTLLMDFEPEGVVEQAGDKLGAIEGQVQGDLERFKGLIETMGVESGAWRGEV